MSILVQLTNGSAYNILRHLETYADLLTTLEETAGTDVGEGFFGRQKQDVQTEATRVKNSIQLASNHAAYVDALLQLGKAAKKVMGEYRHLMGDDTPEITDVYDAITKFENIQEKEL